MFRSAWRVSWCVVVPLLVVALQFQCSYGANILALFVNGYRSHMMVHSTVVDLMLQRGHNVTVVSTLPPDLAPSDRLRLIRLPSHFTDPHAGGTTVTEEGGLDTLRGMFRRIELTAQFLQHPVWRAFLRETDHHFDLLLLGYLFNDYQLGVAAHFGCPAVLIWTGQPTSYVNRLVGNPDYRLHVAQPYDSHQRQGLHALLFGVFEEAVHWWSLRVMEAIYKENFPESRRFPSFQEVRRTTVALALCNHHSISEGPIAPLVPAIVEVGGIQQTATEDVPSDFLPTNLSATAGLVFFSFGTRVRWSKLPVQASQVFADAFAVLHSQYNLTTLWTYDGDCQQLLQRSAPGAIVCRTWWPQSALLADHRVRVFITHGGKGSVSEALHNGVPILGLPLIGDQRVNVPKLVRQGLALSLTFSDQLTAAEIVRSVAILLDDRAGYANRALAFSRRYNDRPRPPNETAVFWLEYVLRHKGARHLRSPLLQLNTLQRHCIDIYALAFTLFVAIIAVFNCLDRWVEQ